MGLLSAGLRLLPPLSQTMSVLFSVYIRPLSDSMLYLTSCGSLYVMWSGELIARRRSLAMKTWRRALAMQSVPPFHTHNLDEDFIRFMGCGNRLRESDRLRRTQGSTLIIYGTGSSTSRSMLAHFHEDGAEWGARGPLRG